MPPTTCSRSRVRVATACGSYRRCNSWFSVPARRRVATQPGATAAFRISSCAPPATFSRAGRGTARGSPLSCPATEAGREGVDVARTASSAVSRLPHRYARVRHRHPADSLHGRALRYAPAVHHADSWELLAVPVTRRAVVGTLERPPRTQARAHDQSRRCVSLVPPARLRP